jgi:hypothetical protein
MLSWRVSPLLPVVKLVAAVAIPLIAFAFRRDDPVAWAGAAGAALGLAAWAVRDLVAPVRLAADTSGLTVVVGYAGRRTLPWAAVERIHLDRRARLGVTSELLEVDAGETVHQFSRYDLDAAPAEVAEALTALRTAPPSAT